MTAWFASGIILIYVPFPDLGKDERLQRAPEIPLELVQVDPSDALRTGFAEGIVDGFWLTAREQRPQYVIRGRAGHVAAVWADTGREASVPGTHIAKEIAEEFSGTPAGDVSGPFQIDQWTVHEKFEQHRPFYRVDLADAAGTHLYVSQRSGEVLQKTDRRERVWNYFGAIVHWIYPTFLRKNWVAWDQTVWWLSLVCIVVTLIGLWLGIDRMRLARKSRRGRLFLFHRWMRWHHMLGIFSGLFVLGWIFSGWLSMDHGRLLSVPVPQEQRIDHFRGKSLREASASISIPFLKSLGSAKELAIEAIAGEAYVVRYTSNDTTIISLAEGGLQGVKRLPADVMTKAVGEAWSEYQVQSVYEVDVADDLYTTLRSSRLPAGTFRFVLSDQDATWVHVHSDSGKIVSVMDKSRRLNRWLFNGLHSFDFPGLVDRRPFWDVVIVALLCLGLIFSVTGVAIGYSRLQRKLLGGDR